MTTQTRVWKAADIECDGCASSIKRALVGMLGVARVEVDVPTQIVTVEYDPEQAPEEAVVATLDKAGFPVVPA